MRSSTRALALGLTLLAEAGCLMQQVTTEIRVRDPSTVALRSEDGGVVVAATGEPADAPLGQGRVETGVGSSAAYEVRARRDDDRSLSVAWTTTLPLQSGDRHTVLPASGSIVLRAPLASVVDAEMLSAPRLVLHWCTRLQPRSARGVTLYDVEPRGCVGPEANDAYAPTTNAAVRYGLDVAWSDVISLRESTRPDHGAAWLIIAASTLTFGTFAGLFAGFSPSSISGGVDTQIAFCTSTILIALAFDAAMLPTLLAHDRDVDALPRAQPR